jgi:hypothetical protein
MEMELSEYIEGKRKWQIFRIWQRFWGFSLEQCDKLPPYLKRVLDSCIGISDKPVTDIQRDELIRALLSIATDGRNISDPIELVIQEEKKKLRPLSEKEIENFYKKYYK